jgi:hypothetical protein
MKFLLLNRLPNILVASLLECSLILMADRTSSLRDRIHLAQYRYPPSRLFRWLTVSMRQRCFRPRRCLSRQCSA